MAEISILILENPFTDTFLSVGVRNLNNTWKTDQSGKAALYQTVWQSVCL